VPTVTHVRHVAYLGVVIYIYIYVCECVCACIDSLQAGQCGDRIPVGVRFYAPHPDRLWGPPSFLYNGNRVCFPGVNRPGGGVDHPPHLVPRLKKE
jgi:hypothetical protein